MTPTEAEEINAAQAEALAAGCIGRLLGAAMAYAVLTPMIMFAWNVGLEDAGFVHVQISWLTSLALAVVLMIIRGTLAAVAGRRIR